MITADSQSALKTVHDVLEQFRTYFSALTLLVGRQEGHPACKN